MKVIPSTMAGTVLEIIVVTGDVVELGKTVVLLESMKMEIPVESLETGKIAEIKVMVGDFVNDGDVLLVLE